MADKNICPACGKSDSKKMVTITITPPFDFSLIKNFGEDFAALIKKYEEKK